MKRLLSAKPLFAVIAVGTLLAASAAHARTDVVLSIGVPAPYGYVQPQPVYVLPQPVYVRPQPIYYGGYRGHGYRGAWGDADRDGVPNIYDRDTRHYVDARAMHRHGAWGDADRDGVPNLYDRAPTNPYRR